MRIATDGPEIELDAPAKRRPPSAPVLAKEITDHILGMYDWNPSDWRTILTVMAYMQRLGRYWSLETRKK